MTSLKRSWVWLLGLGLACCLVGCGRKDDPTAAGPPGPPGMPPMGPPPGFDMDAEPHAAGKKVFVTNGCFRCHSIGKIGAPPTPSGGGPPPGGPPGPGRPGMGRNRGPDLAKIGEDPSHTVEWFMAYVRNPKSKKENARMPAFDKISEPDLRALAEYLASLK